MITFPVANLKYIFPHPDYKITDAKLKYFIQSISLYCGSPSPLLQIENKKRVRIRFRWLHKHRVACSVILSDSRGNYLKRNLFEMSSWIKLEGENSPTFCLGWFVNFMILRGFCLMYKWSAITKWSEWSLMFSGGIGAICRSSEKTVEESEYWEPSFNSLCWGVHRGFSVSTLRALLYYSEPQNTFAMVCYWCHKGNRTEGTRETDGITWDSI